jgi:Haem-NO-binding
MHGIIFSELKKYVETRFSVETWPTLLNEAGLGSKLYMGIQSYPDQDAVALVTTAARLTGQSAPAILEDFGTFIAPDLLGMYRTLLRPDWKTLELLENVERTIHTVVRARHHGAAPAQITCSRTGPNEVILTYRSARRMCPVAKGIVLGLGQYYGQKVSVRETQCTHRGAETCMMTVRTA